MTIRTMHNIDYDKLLEESFNTEKTLSGDDLNRLEYISRHIFNFVTYSGDIDVILAQKALYLCDIISNGKGIDHTKTEMEQTWLIIILNTPFFINHIDWGTSIFSSWWLNNINYESDGLFFDGKQIFGVMNFNVHEWKRFLAALDRFAKK